MSDSYTNTIQKFENTLEKFEKVLEMQGEDLQEIKRALLGTKFGDHGLVRRIEEAEKEVSELKDFKNRIYWIVVGLSAGVGGGSFGILKLIFGL